MYLSSEHVLQENYTVAAFLFTCLFIFLNADED